VAPCRPAVAAGGFVYVSGTLAQDGAVDSLGGVATQTRQVIERLRDVLDGAGTSLDRVVAVTVYLRSAADFQAMNDAYKMFWPEDPPTRTTVIVDLVGPDARVEMSAIAVPPGGERVVIHPKDWISSPSPYSYAIRSGDTLFLSGLVARNGRDNSVVPGDIAVQTRAVLDNGGELLEAAGLDFENVVSTRIFLPDASAFQQMNDAYAKYFSSKPPARATVRADLAGSQYAVEMTMIASSSARDAIDSGTEDGPRLPLSPAFRAGNRVYVSGALGFTETNKTDAAAQAREVLARIGRTLSAAGCSPADVVDTTVFLTDLRNYEAMNEPYRAFFGGNLPARTTVGTGLIAPDGLVEIMMTAVDR
jgi:reactive intermediate/imine deaminase